MIRLSTTITLLSTVLALSWYAVCSNRIAAKDLAFINGHDSTGLFADALLLKGYEQYYNRLNPEQAIQAYRLAISREPLFIPAWLALARTELAEGKETESAQVATALSSLIAPVSTWKWQELLLAFDLKEDEYFQTNFNFILERLPYRISEACYLASQYWGSFAAVIPHLAPANQTIYLNQLMGLKEIDAALALFHQMNHQETPAKSIQLQFCQFLLANNRLPEAKKVWTDITGNPIPMVENGSFEEEHLNQAFGWRFNTISDTQVRRTSETAFEGVRSLQVHFNGTTNANFHHVSQIVPVKPGASYRLQFAHQSRNLTTDQGVFIEVLGYQCKGLYAAGPALLGTTRWAEEELPFEVPADCEAVTIRVRRKDSLMFDNKIAGDYWLDAVVLGGIGEIGRGGDRETGG